MSGATEAPATDRGLASEADLDGLAYDARGLVPVVAQDAASGAVLMMAWANRDALARSLATREMHFWSRSRAALWKKGETSGNVLRVRTLHADCDGDTVLALVDPTGPACHTGEPTCFGRAALPATVAAPPPPPGAPEDAISALWRVLEARARERPEGSYTTRLLGDENLRIKKLGEETAELILALARSDRERTTEEASDLLYHLLVALLAAGVTLEAVQAELAARGR